MHAVLGLQDSEGSLRNINKKLPDISGSFLLLAILERQKANTDFYDDHDKY
jgi:hypothetical protein